MKQSTIPHPIIKRMKWFYPLVWLVPLGAAALTTYYFVERRRDRGPEITVQFNDATGFKPGETLVDHLGVEIGKVNGVTLSGDHAHVEAHVQLHRSASDFARRGARFWIIKPQFSTESISGLNTFFSGPYVEAEPGQGAPAESFVGLDRPPVAPSLGLEIVLHAPRLEKIQSDSPVYYRGVQVGTVRDVQLSRDATGVDAHVIVAQRYAVLVHDDSCFWLVKGANIEGSLFSGVQVKLSSLRALISGGISFATPNATSPRADDGQDFPLYDDAKKEW